MPISILGEHRTLVRRTCIYNLIVWRENTPAFPSIPLLLPDLSSISPTIISFLQNNFATELSLQPSTLQWWQHAAIHHSLGLTPLSHHQPCDIGELCNIVGSNAPVRAIVRLSPLLLNGAQELCVQSTPMVWSDIGFRSEQQGFMKVAPAPTPRHRSSSISAQSSAASRHFADSEIPEGLSEPRRSKRKKSSAQDDNGGGMQTEEAESKQNAKTREQHNHDNDDDDDQDYTPSALPAQKRSKAGRGRGRGRGKKRAREEPE